MSFIVTVEVKSCNKTTKTRVCKSYTTKCILIAFSQKVMHWSLNHFYWQYYCYFCWFFSKLIPFLFLVSIVTCIIKQCFYSQSFVLHFCNKCVFAIACQILFYFVSWRFFLAYCILMNAAICLRCFVFCFVKVAHFRHIKLVALGLNCSVIFLQFSTFWCTIDINTIAQ